jgi:hypothetical protein
MGLPAFLVAATAILSSGGGGGGGGAAAEEAAPVIPTPDDFATWTAANKPDADFTDQFSSYVNYLNEDQFGLTAEERGAYIPEHVVSDYTQKIHATEADMKNDDRSFYDQRLREGTTDFDSWLSNESDDVKNSGYGSQYQRYKNQMNAILNQRPDWMGEDDSSYTTFSSYDPGLFVAGEDYGDFAGSYRSRDDADSAFRNYYAKQIGDFGYGNLIQEDMDNAGYLSAYNEAKARNDYGSLITDLG